MKRKTKRSLSAMFGPLDMQKSRIKEMTSCEEETVYKDGVCSGVLGLRRVEKKNFSDQRSKET